MTTLLEIPLDEALRVKWERGRAERGLTFCAPFQGDPVSELYEELLDAIHYARLAGFERLELRLRAEAEEVRAWARQGAAAGR